MSKSKKKNKNRKKRVRRAAPIPDHLPVLGYQDKEGYHAIMPGMPPSPEQLEQMTRDYQARIKKSPMWKTMIKRLGPDKANELLKEFQVKLR